MPDKILQEFERLYRGDPYETESLCKQVAENLKMDFDTVLMHVYTNRYQNEEEENGND